MQLAPDGTLIVSATDLVGFLACDHLTSLELGRIEGFWDRPPEREDPEVVLLQERGEAHEQAYLARLRAENRSIHEISLRHPRTPEELREAESETLDALRRGVDVVFQATFFDGRWRGHADFLLKVDGPSALGDWHYEVADTKLARSVKGSALLQVCVYSERLAHLQGRQPALVHVVTGDGTTHSHRLDDYAAFYRTVKRRFEERVFGSDRPPAGSPNTYPNPVDHCRVCAWFPTCIERRRTDDHPSLVAGMTRAATERLMTTGVTTLAQLGGLPADSSVPDLNPRTLERLRNQARLQLEGRRTRRLQYELIEPIEGEPGRGLALLPEPSALDLFFDIEADPWAMDDGLEYLLGVVELVGGAPRYHAIWGHDRPEEKAAFEQFIDLVMDRLARDPGMHVYHYAGYESGAIKRLMQRHATREDEVDRLLRGDVLVDLYTVVRQSVRASVESYSLKQIEKFYLPARDGPITEAGFSVVEYERWLRDRDRSHLDDLAAYNRDDCVSTALLRDWLEERRTEAIGLGWSMERPAQVDGLPSDAQNAQQEETRRRIEALTADVPADRTSATDDQRARWLLAQLLDWHRRDAKPQWWAWYQLKDAGTDELIDSGEALGGLVFESELGPRKKSLVRRYRYPPQDHKIRLGSHPVDPGHGEHGDDAGEVLAIDDIACTIDVVRGPGKLGYHPSALIPAKPIPTDVLRNALRRVADAVLDGGVDGPGTYRAARDLLLRLPPRLGSHHPQPAGVDLVNPGESLLDAARRLARDLEHGVLPIQGPPGTGKTWTGARMIAALVGGGFRVGITAQTHKAITNLLVKTHEACAEARVPFAAIQRCETGDDGAHLAGLRLAEDTGEVADGLTAGTYAIGAGTSWLWSRPELDDSIDVLFVDEAGQLSLANAVAVAGAARSVVLLGDPNQLPQVSAGIHPEGAAASGLEHLVGSSVTVAPDRGLFLDTTYRLHPGINDYISEIFYEDRLRPHPSTSRQRLDGSPPMGGLGIRWLPVTHAGNGSSSAQEAEAVAQAVEDLVGRRWIDRRGHERGLDIDDLVVVAPYNAHVAAIDAAIERRLGRRARVGTVDRFQGQEAPVAIYSMAASSADDAPRGMDFLYDGHRLNVAVSRAMGLALVVASPELLRVKPRSADQLRKANALCRLVEVAGADRDGDGYPDAGADPANLILWPELRPDA